MTLESESTEGQPEISQEVQQKLDEFRKVNKWAGILVDALAKADLGIAIEGGGLRGKIEAINLEMHLTEALTRGIVGLDLSYNHVHCARFEATHGGLGIEDNLRLNLPQDEKFAKWFVDFQQNILAEYEKAKTPPQPETPSSDSQI